MEKKLHDIVVRAITAVGVENFKRTSLFLSNERAESSLKKAA